jgi:multidrug resistance efflux pump
MNLVHKLQSGSASPDSARVSATFGQANDASQTLPRQDASALQGRLAEEFARPGKTKKSSARPDQTAPLLSPVQSRILKSVVGLAILVSVGWMPVQRLLQVSSVEAVVNARVVTLRAPISGVVSETQGPRRVGAAVTAGNVLMTVRNVRADHNGIERATGDLQSAKEDLAAATARIDRLTSLRAAIAVRVDDYRADRIRRVGADLAVADAQIASAQAMMDRAAAEVARQSSLAARGISAQATKQTAERNLAVARASVDQAKAQKASLVVEASALKAGRFFGDSYNDVPQSVQRLDEIDEALASLKADQGRLATRVKRLTSDLQHEQGRFDLASHATLKAPVGGQIWEILTSPGEQVVAGQPLVSLLDCSRLLVTAAVSESVYNSLSIGTPARFTFREGGRAFSGRVVQLSGVAAAGSNFAITPSALVKESYRVTTTVDGMAGDGVCPVGQTGRVVFGKAAS